MSRTIRNTAVLDAPVRDGKQVRSIRRLNTVTRRTGTRAAIIAAAIAEAGVEL